MFRTVACAAAAVLLTTGAVAAMADTVDTVAQPKVTVDKAGDYCLTSDAVTGTLLPRRECHSLADWSKQGIGFVRR